MKLCIILMKSQLVQMLNKPIIIIIVIIIFIIIIIVVIIIYYYYNHNYNKIVKSDWLSTALISALIGQFDRTVRVMPK